MTSAGLLLIRFYGGFELSNKMKRSLMQGLVTIGSSRRLELTDGEQVLFVESSSSPMLDAAGSRPASHLAQVRAAERASVACVSSGRTPTTAMDALK